MPNLELTHEQVVLAVLQDRKERFYQEPHGPSVAYISGQINALEFVLAMISTPPLLEEPQDAD